MDSLPKPINVLISLYKGYGMGDAVKMSAVLRHVKKYRPHWTFDFQAEEGRECIGRGIANRVFTYSNPYNQSHPYNYDAEVQIYLYNVWKGWTDRPNTHVANCLHDTFDIPWDEELGRYQVAISIEMKHDVDLLLRGGKWVAVHHQGDSSPDKKNITIDQANEVCEMVWKLGYSPLALDLRDKSPGLRYIRLTDRHWKRGANVEAMCGIISYCKAFIGIDSGPAKCASATNTPSLVIWTGHHPAQFHDPAPNTTHLVPQRYHDFFPVCNNQGVINWFESHYKVREYIDGNPIPQVKKWLEEVLR